MMDMLESDSEFDGYIETSDSDDQEDVGSFGSHALSILSNMDESIGRIDQYLAFERGFHHGDIVCSVKDPCGQMGRVIDVDMVVDLESTKGDILNDINSKKLCRVRSLGEGDYVVCGSWLGRVVRVYDLVTVLLHDGGRCKISTRDCDGLVPISPSVLEDGPFTYYLGQHVKINRNATLRSPGWFCGTRNAGPTEGTVCKIEIGSVVVNWIASIGGAFSTACSPPRLQDAANLTLLSCFSHANWQIGDWCKLSADYYNTLHDGAEESAIRGVIPESPTERKKLKLPHFGSEELFIVTKTKSKIGVLWQDGSCSFGVDLQTLSPVNTIDDHDFWPGQFVLEKAISEDAYIANAQCLGIVKNVHAQERTVKVKWVSLCQDNTSDYSEETVSAYELIEHPDYSYCLGDIVCLKSRCFTDSEDDGHLHVCPPVRMDRSVLQLLEKDDWVKDHSDYQLRYLSWIGNIVGLKDGSVAVRWASGISSEVQPCEIMGLDKFDVALPSPVPTNEEVFGKVIPENDRQLVIEKENEQSERDLDNSEGGCMRHHLISSAFWFSHAAIRFMTKSAASYFGFQGFNALSVECADGLSGNLDFVQPPSPETTEHFDQSCTVPEKPVLNLEGLQSNMDSSCVPVQEDTDSKVQLGLKKQYKNFDIVEDYSDHNFINANAGGSMLSQVKSSWLKKIQKEWNILEKNLPDTIFVRAYEQRVDLLRAAIVGAAGTPYEDALFFFDICFPPEYPNEPPMVHYFSGGLRLNPNLYESGKVCLSLLKTWTGTGTEVWNPESSTILQVLLSLQALVLNDKPYFNEAGYDKQVGKVEGERNSITYNENAFLLSRKSMIYQLNKPLKHFEALVEEHFNSRSHEILSACEGYMDSVEDNVGFACGEEVAIGDQKYTSTGFKIILAKLLPKLISTFKEKGINCNFFLKEATFVPPLNNQLEANLVDENVA